MATLAGDYNNSDQNASPSLSPLAAGRPTQTYRMNGNQQQQQQQQQQQVKENDAPIVRQASTTSHSTNRAFTPSQERRTAPFDGPIIPMPVINTATVRNSHLLAVVDALKAETRELRDEIDVKNQTVISLGNTLYETQQSLQTARLTSAQQGEQIKLFTSELVTMKTSENALSGLREQIKRLEAELGQAEEAAAMPLRQELEMLKQQRSSDDTKLIDWKNQVKVALKEGKKRETAMAEDREHLKRQLAEADLKITELGFQLERVTEHRYQREAVVDGSTMTDVAIADDQLWLAMVTGSGNPMSWHGSGNHHQLSRANATSPISNDGGGGALPQLRIPSAAEALAPSSSYEPINSSTFPYANAFATSSLQLVIAAGGGGGGAGPDNSSSGGGSPANYQNTPADWTGTGALNIATNSSPPSCQAHGLGSAASAAIDHAHVPLYWYYRPSSIERSLFLGLSPLQQRVVSLGRKHFQGILDAEKDQQHQSNGGIDVISLNNTFVGASGDSEFPLPAATTSAKTFLIAKGAQLPVTTAMSDAVAAPSPTPFIVTVRFSGRSDVAGAQANSDGSQQQQGWSLDAKMLVKPGMSVFDLVVQCCGKFSMRYDSQIDPNVMTLSIHHEPSKRRVTLAPHREMHSYSYVTQTAQKGEPVVFSLVESNGMSESVQRYMDTQV